MTREREPWFDAREAVSLLADELNQFAMAVEGFAYRSQASAEARLADKESERYGDIFKAARRLRERIAPLIVDDAEAEDSHPKP